MKINPSMAYALRNFGVIEDGDLTWGPIITVFSTKFLRTVSTVLQIQTIKIQLELINVIKGFK